MGLFKFVLISALNGGVAIAAPPSTNSCAHAASPLDFYRCSLSMHPDALVVEKTHVAADAALSRSGKFANPELGLKNTGGKSGGEKVAGLEITLAFPISDYLLARSPRLEIGAAEKLQMDTEAKEIQFESKRQVMKDLFRYRQLLAETAFVDEVLSTFASIEKQFRSRRAPGPDQQITLNLVVLAQSDYELKKNHLVVEKQEIESRFKVIWGDNFAFEKSQLPAYRKEWPKIKPKFDPANHFELQKLLAEKNKSSGELSAANAESWPAFKIGPVMERNAEGPVSVTSYGFALTVDVPIFSWNAGGRNFAEAQKIKTESQYDVAARRAQLENELVFKKYESSVQALKRSEDRENLAKKHSTIDSLFRQGLTSGSTIIEAHRQIWEFTESQHEHEMTALDSLLTLNQLQGKEPIEVLQ